nr:MAG TPA: hypothetical protein [Caudoviricetes sp.]
MTDKLNTKSLPSKTRLDLDCSQGIYFEVTISPGNIFNST